MRQILTETPDFGKPTKGGNAFALPPFVKFYSGDERSKLFKRSLRLANFPKQEFTLLMIACIITINYMPTGVHKFPLK